MAIMYTSYMEWILMGAVILILFLVLLGLYFGSSGAVNIAEEEREEIEKESPEQIAKEVEVVEKENIQTLKTEEDEFYSHG